jgi:hypothetical protein
MVVIIAATGAAEALEEKSDEIDMKCVACICGPEIMK